MKPFTETERQEFLAATHVGMLSVAAADGRPPASVPIWYDYTLSGNIRINTGAGARKAKLIERAEPHPGAAWRQPVAGGRNL